MFQNILNNITVNISILVIIGFTISRFAIFRKAVFDHEKSWVEILVLSVIFGSIGILSTYTGIRINGAIANTRVIGVIAGGLLGGPLVGLFAGIIAGFHRFAIEVNGFTALSCAISTVLEGVIGGYMYKRVQQSDNKYVLILITTFFAEVMQMIVILLIAKPFEAAVDLVKLISVPMVFLNPIGVVIFIYGIYSVKETMERQNEHNLKLAFDIVEMCLPFLRKGLHDKDSMTNACDIILKKTRSITVLITSGDEIIAYAGKDISKLGNFGECFNQLTQDIYTYKETIILDENTLKTFKLDRVIKRIMVSPTKRNDNVIGSIAICDNRIKTSSGLDLGFIKGLSRLFSSQLALAEMDTQTQLLQKAEFRALQSQINPHFLFNALTTISGYTRENPDRARQLLLALSSYFRNTLSSHQEWVDIQEELEHVLSYLEIEKARFESRLEVVIDCDPDIRFRVPNFIIQPLIENAIKHAMSAETLRVDLNISQSESGLDIVIHDNGSGIDSDYLIAFYAGKADKNKIGLANIHQRLKSIYPNNPGLKITSLNGQGTRIQMFLPQGSGS